MITSGMALGIFAAGHSGALDGGGKTIAVTGTGLDRIYPARHEDLAPKIAENGALVIEFPVGMQPFTARLAQEQGRGNSNTRFNP